MSTATPENTTQNLKITKFIRIPYPPNQSSKGPLSLVEETSMAVAVAVAVAVEEEVAVSSKTLHMTGRNMQDIREDKL